MEITTVAGPALWAGFLLLVLTLLALDLGVLNRGSHVLTVRAAAIWSAVWIAVALAFNVWVAVAFGRERGLEFLTGYVLEKALAVDNIFVFLIIFSVFEVPLVHQRQVLFWGVLGALVMRAAFIALGAVLLAKFHWVMYVFGGILLLTAVKLLRGHGTKVHPERTLAYRLFTRLVPTVPEYHGGRFLIRRDGRWFATPLLVVLVCIEATDLVFALDSIPAIFAVTRDPFIVFTSNVFAILGLRSLFFVLRGAVERFRYLEPALAMVLGFVGVKLLLLDAWPIPIGASLGVVGTVLTVAAGASWIADRREAARPEAAPAQ